MKFLKINIGKRIVLLLIFLLMYAVPAFCYPEEQGVSAAELLRQIAIVVTIIAIAGLIVVEFFLKNKIARGSYKWALFLGLFMLPVIAMVGSTTTLMHETTTVESCASCHIMEPFVNDLRNEESPTLAARHFKNKWIAENQCYHCHTSYGIHGTAEAKRDGFRHWLLYVTETWPEPITFKGSYPNQNCTTCHGSTKKFQTVNSHIALREKLMNNEVSCASCHGPAHPTPLERGNPIQPVEPSDNQEDELVWNGHGVENPQEVYNYVKALATERALSIDHSSRSNP
jgi:cytochrome c nitrite reductase small subunit